MYPHYIAKNPFFADLLQKAVTIPEQLYIPLFVVNTVLIFLIGRHFFEKKYHLVPLLVYLLTPWIYYESIANSFYITLLATVLVAGYGAIRIEINDKKLGNILFIGGFLVSAYLSFPLLITLPLLFISLLILKVLSLKKFRLTIVAIFLMSIPLLFLVLRNPAGFTNTVRNDVQIFSDPTLLNSINRYQGAAEKTGLKILGRISENKYLFFSEFFALKYMTQLIPEVYFTPQYRLLGFSFAPPVLLGFIFPFIYGLFFLFKNPRTRNILLASSLLVVPSVLAHDFVSLNRLVLFGPIIIFAISFGLVKLYEEKTKIGLKTFLIITAFLVLFQLILVINDVKTREFLRFQKYYGQNYEITEP